MQNFNYLIYVQTVKWTKNKNKTKIASLSCQNGGEIVLIIKIYHFAQSYQKDETEIKTCISLYTTTTLENNTGKNKILKNKKCLKLANQSYFTNTSNSSESCLF